LQQQRPQELLGRDGRPADPGIQLIEPRRQLLQEAVHHRPHAPQRMIRRDAPLHRHVAPHRALLLLVVAAHAHLLRCRHAHRNRTVMLARYQKSGFSAACWTGYTPFLRCGNSCTLVCAYARRLTSSSRSAEPGTMSSTSISEASLWTSTSRAYSSRFCRTNAARSPSGSSMILL